VAVNETEPPVVAETVRAADVAPAVVGVKPRMTEQDPMGGSSVPVQVFEVTGNEVALVLTNVSALVATSPMLVMVHVYFELEFPTETSLNAFVVDVGESVAGFCTVAVRACVWREPGMAEAVSVAVLRPLPLAAVAVNRTGVVQDAPPGRGWPS
jgi:hypothetical protein